MGNPGLEKSKQGQGGSIHHPLSSISLTPEVHVDLFISSLIGAPTPLLTSGGRKARRDARQPCQVSPYRNLRDNHSVRDGYRGIKRKGGGGVTPCPVVECELRETQWVAESGPFLIFYA
ncbi:hypothetical protein CDAR_4891 [Caerostris darwini]|uniref:Uncharacterized protein n=1 Tax=Caerostris darwini TaxID=1538125 RepID=A0AAV4P3D7_9ARAC|nr:hypothetical protein CDAR_4891 [Caerostris darwini]